MIHGVLRLPVHASRQLLIPFESSILAVVERHVNTGADRGIRLDEQGPEKNALMQATGMGNDHTTDCFRYRQISNR